MTIIKLLMYVQMKNMMVRHYMEKLKVVIYQERFIFVTQTYFRNQVC